MNRYGQFSGYGNGSSLEANPFPELEALCPQDAIGRAAGQDDRDGFLEKAAPATAATVGKITVPDLELCGNHSALSYSSLVGAGSLGLQLHRMYVVAISL